MTRIPASHPRYASLVTRERLAEAFRKGIVAEAGLIAHGRGEAFDYILGEDTTGNALDAAKAAVLELRAARHPALSVNGNVAALCANQIPALQRAYGLTVEVNLFHRTEERMRLVAGALREAGVEGVLGEKPDSTIPGLDHARAHCTGAGIGSADVVVVPLEDGDRAQALVAMGKRVITIDLNPMSRTARCAHVTIVDEVTRAFRTIAELADNEISFEKPFDNGRNLAEALSLMRGRLGEIARRESGSPEPLHKL